jgi:subtilisin family serine protease
MVPLTPLLALEAADLVRVDDPGWPGAIARSATGATLAAPPPAGTPWRYEAVPVPDPIEVETATHARAAWRAVDALAVTNAADWHARGITGAGVKIALFDSGFYGGEAPLSELGDFTTHDCQLSSSCEPPMDMNAPTFSFEEGMHGIACAEVIHDIAPDAELHLVRVNTFTTFENAVAWAAREGIDVISMSMSFYNQSFYDGTGPFDPQLEILESAGALLVSSAGNNAGTHWSGPWRDGNGDLRHDGDGDDGFLVYDADTTPSFYLGWNRYGRCTETDLDLYVYDLHGNRLGASLDVQAEGEDRCEPNETLSSPPSSDGWYRLEVVLRRGSAAGLAIDVLPRDMDMIEGDPAGSVADPGSNPLTFAVGAVEADGYLEKRPEYFSSHGPTNAGLRKPDIAGPDGLTSSIYGTAGFYGTSASTPAVSALVALVMSEEPGISSREASRRLQGWAFGEEAFGPDNALGAGKARLPVPSDDPQPCGRRRMAMPMFLLPVWWFALRRR